MGQPLPITYTPSNQLSEQRRVAATSATSGCLGRPVAAGGLSPWQARCPASTGMGSGPVWERLPSTDGPQAHREPQHRVTISLPVAWTHHQCSRVDRGRRPESTCQRLALGCTTPSGETFCESTSLSLSFLACTSESVAVSAWALTWSLMSGPVPGLARVGPQATADLNSFNEAAVSLRPSARATVTSGHRLSGPRQQREFLTVLDKRNAK